MSRQIKFILAAIFTIFLANSCSDSNANNLSAVKNAIQNYLKGNEKSVNSNKNSFVVTKVIDGDTFWVIDSKDVAMKIRLIGIDAPESRNVFKKKKEYYGVESKAYLTKLIHNQTLHLEFDVDSLDQYGRTLAYAYLMNGALLNENIVKSGHATILTITPNIKYEAKFYNAQRFARENNLGLWRQK